MIDLHLAYTALLGLGIGTVVVLVLAAAIIAIAAIRPHRPLVRRRRQPAIPATSDLRVPALR